MRATILWSVILCVLSVSLTRQPPNLTVSEQEEFTLETTSFFSGCDLAFQVSASAGLQLRIADPARLSLLDSFPHKNPSAIPPTLKHFNFAGEEFVLSAKGSVLSALKASISGENRHLWDVQIEGNCEIRRVERVQTMSGVALLLLLEEAGNGAKVVLLALLDLESAPVAKPEPLQFAEIRSLTDIDFEVFLLHQMREKLLFIGKSRESAHRDVLIIYEWSINTEPRLVQRIDRFDGAAETPLSIIRLLSDSVMVYVLDRQLGLVKFAAAFEKVQTSERVDLSQYGEAVGMQFVVGIAPRIAVVTKLGVVLLNKKDSTVAKWISGAETCEVPWVAESAVLFENFLFTTMAISSHPFLQVIDHSQMSLMHGWRLDDYIAVGNIMLGSDSLIIPTYSAPTFIYIRSDQDAVRVFRLTLGNPTVRGKADKMGVFEGTISAISLQLPERSVTVKFGIDVMALRNDTVFLGMQYELSSTNSSLIYTKAGPNPTFEVHPSMMFSGPDLTFSARFTSISAGVQFKVSPVPLKTYTVHTHTLPGVSLANVIFDSSSDDVSIIRNQSLLVFHVSEAEVRVVKNVTIPEGKLTAICTECTDVIMLVERDSGEKTLVMWKHELESFATIPLSSPCENLKALTPFFACFSPTSITIFANHSSSRWTLSASSLSLTSLRVVDLFVKYSVFAQAFYLYVACVDNGLFIVDLPTSTNLQPSVVTVISESVKFVTMHNNWLSRVNADGSVTVFDLYRAPEIREIRTLPSWSTEAVISATTVNEFLIVQHETKAYFYELKQPVHNSLHMILEIDEGCRLKGSKTYVIRVCAGTEGVVVSLFGLHVPMMKGKHTGWKLDIQTEVEENNKDLRTLWGVLEVEAVSSFGDRRTTEVVFEVNP